MSAAAGMSSASATAIGAAVVVNDGIKISGRTGMGGYTRINSSTVQWLEAGDFLPSQPFYDTIVPFYPADTGTTPITITGGRTYSHFLTISLDGDPVDITTARFISQIRSTDGGTVLASFTPIVLDGPNGDVQLALTAYETQVAAAMSSRGIWDVEMQIDGLEVTVVPRSRVTLVMGVSQAVSFPVESPAGISTGFPAEVTVS